MSFARINEILPRPTTPVELPVNDDWSALEARLGIVFPQDYKQFIQEYGSGRIANFLWILNPFSKNSNINLENQLQIQRRVLADLSLYGESIPYGVFPVPGGVLPFGITDNGDMLYWLTLNKPEGWKIVVNESRSPEWEVFDLGFAEFLLQLIERRITCSAFPTNFPGHQVGFEVNH
ncbi:SMI1/KNR4 family protein [Cupriavidus sp. WS]|uniref:SMI1/KNR4 family protein n=1 Tax=Cupriavidus sp. WS TaxID=1312922 RepID=UPI0009DB9601|nr:SMI1/KNR4 family protein [Cupriavidus sp. WS]